MCDLKKCENCDNDHNGDYGSGRFCSNKCARGFSTKNKRKEINKKVSNTLQLKLNNGLTTQQVIQKKYAAKHASYIRETEITTLYDLSTRTISKILKRLKLPCSLCKWYVEDVVGDLHHIIERKNGGSNNHDNLTYVCPNCHRLIHSNKIDNSKIINLKDYIGDEWKKYYYVINKKLINK
jgi:hypothetical protein